MAVLQTTFLDKHDHEALATQSSNRLLCRRSNSEMYISVHLFDASTLRIHPQDSSNGEKNIIKKTQKELKEQIWMAAGKFSQTKANGHV